MSALLQLRDVTISRGPGSVVRGLSLDVVPGEITALLGPNGAGKSSLVLGVGGVLPLQSGSVTADGRELRGKRPEAIRRAGLAIVPEGRRLLRGLSVADNLSVATYSLPRRQAAAGRARALELFPELGKRMNARAGALSGGEQQMLVLAQALVSEPRWLLVDELSLGLAPVVVQRLVPVLREVADRGVGVLLIEQFASLALGVSNVAYVIDRGSITLSGRAEELRAHPEVLHSAYLRQGNGA